MLKDAEYMDEPDKYTKYKKGDVYMLEDGMTLYLRGVDFGININ
jgi:hypothetical protein